MTTTDPLHLSRGQLAALRALVDHGGQKQAADALGISEEALYRRLRTARERTGLATLQLCYRLGQEEPTR